MVPRQTQSATSMVPLVLEPESRSTCNSRRKSSSSDSHLSFKADPLSGPPCFFLELVRFSSHGQRAEVKMQIKWNVGARLDTWAGNAIYYLDDRTGRRPRLQLRRIRC